MITREVAKAWRFLRERGLKATIFARNAPFLIQFGKYGVCGVLSVVIFLIVALLGEHLFPQSFGENASAETRARFLPYLHFAAFLPSNFTAYALNRWLVFTPGRHNPRKEISLFTLISFLSFALGELLPVWLVANCAVPNAVAHLSFVISSALVNFVCRKFLVFQK